jgi:hypothetical protein
VSLVANQTDIKQRTMPEIWLLNTEFPDLSWKENVSNAYGSTTQVDGLMKCKSCAHWASLTHIPVVPHKAVAEVSKIGNL